MNNPSKQIKQKNDIDIQDFYAVKIGALWRGFMNEHLSFWALCAYFFFEYVRPQYIYPVLDVVPWGQITLILTLIAAFLDQSIKWVSNIENKLIVFFFVVVILSGVFAFSPSVSWSNWVFFVNWFLVYFLMINILNTEKRLFIFMLLFLLFSFKMSQHGFFVFAQRGFSFADWGLGGPKGWFRNSGEFAIQMLIFVSLSAAFIFAIKEHWGRYKKWFFYLMPVTGLFCIVGASSRGAQLALGVLLLGVLLRWKERGKAIVVLVMLSLTLLYFLPEEQKQRFEAVGHDASSLQRFAYWDLGVDIMNEHPVLGIGYYNWLNYGDYMHPEGVGPYGKIQLPHNIFIQAGAELGYAGLAIFIIMIIYVFVINSRTRNISDKIDNRFFYYLTYGLDAGLVGYLIAGFFVTVMYYPFYWVGMALSVATYSIAKTRLDSGTFSKL